MKHTYPGSTVASLKLNEIGGVLIQQWSMWFNAIIPAKSYQNKKLIFIELENYSISITVLHGRHQFVLYGLEFSYRNERNPLTRLVVMKQIPIPSTLTQGLWPPLTRVKTVQRVNNFSYLNQKFTLRYGPSRYSILVAEREYCIGGAEVRSLWSTCFGLHICYNGGDS